MNFATLIRKNLFRKRARTALLLVATFMAFLIYGVLSAFSVAFSAGVSLASANRLVVVNKINFTQQMPMAYVNRIAAMQNVKDISYADWFGGFFREAKNEVMTFAVDPQTYLQVFSEITLSDAERQAFLSDRSGMLVGDMMARRMGWKVGDRIPLSSAIYVNTGTGGRTWDLTIRGIFTGSRPEFATNFVLFQHPYFNETRDMGKDTVGWMVLRTTDSTFNEQVIQAIDAQFANSPDETETTTEEAFNKAFLEQIGSISLIIKSVTGAAFATILMIVGNSMYRAITERTKEIAIMKTLGFTSRSIFTLVLAESFALALIGGLLGLAAASAMVYVVGPLIVSILPGMTMTTSTVLSSIGFMLLLGAITGAVPAWQAMRSNIITGLGKAS